MRRKGEFNGKGGTSKERKPPKGRKSSSPDEADSIVLWRQPVTTLNFFCRELFLTVKSLFAEAINYKKTLVIFTIVVVGLLVSVKIDGPHQFVVGVIRSKILWCLYWIGLGVLSSIGLGSGLHTFLLYLGPHIAAVTTAAFECQGTNFPEPPYPSEILCSDDKDPSWTGSIWSIVWKVHLEAFMWGAGTALGELPPYFMARTARLSGRSSNDEVAKLERRSKHPENLSLVDKAKVKLERFVHRAGFLGVLACASIPNPLFDLAGITCGHFLMPFSTFFGATLIGKAVIKMSVQVLFVILAFSNVLIDKVMTMLGAIPAVGVTLQSSLQQVLELQREKFHKGTDSEPSDNSNPLATAFQLLVLSMVFYFVVSIINSLAQSYHQRSKESKKNRRKD